jgi:hypothetical protein
MAPARTFRNQSRPAKVPTRYAQEAASLPTGRNPTSATRMP